MPTIIPPGYNVYSATFNVSGSTHNVTITCAATNGGLTLPTNMLAQWITAFTGSNRPFHTAQMATGYELVYQKLIANVGGTLLTADSVVKTIGAGTTTPPPMNTATLVNKVTGIAGRRYRGRMFSPPFISESNVDAAGTIAAGALSALQTLWNNAYTDLTVNANPILELDPVLLHGNGDPPTPITSFQVSQRIGTIGRRMRR